MNNFEIFGTIGPSCNDKDTLIKLMNMGMNGVRLNLSHSNLWDHEDWLLNIKEASMHTNTKTNLLIDMKGPELRLASDDEITNLYVGSTITFSNRFIPEEIFQNAESNDILLIDDGQLRLKIEKIEYPFLWCQSLSKGQLKGKKNIAIENKSITASVLCENDIENLKQAYKYGVTSIMQPFVRGSDDLIRLKEVLHSLNLDHLKIYAKIENKEGFENIESIIPYCDVIVIARGDLGNAYGLIKLPIIQHKIEQICKKYNKPYMVVTQMLHSMHNKDIPTRAEVSDIFNAVYNGASSIMLTGETASGNYPLEAMKYFTQVALETLKFKGE